MLRRALASLVLLAPAVARADDGVPVFAWQRAVRPGEPRVALDVGEERLELLATRLEARERAFRAERRDFTLVLLVEAVGSVAASIPLLANPGADESWRVAGGVTLSFGVANLAFVVPGLVDLARDEARWARPRGKKERRTAWGFAKAARGALDRASGEAAIFALNLGLDALYLSGGALAVGGGAAGFEHPARWTAAGVALATQAAFLSVYDGVGWALASRRHHVLLQDLVLAPSPMVVIGGAGVGVRGSF